MRVPGQLKSLKMDGAVLTHRALASTVAALSHSRYLAYATGTVYLLIEPLSRVHLRTIVLIRTDIDIYHVHVKHS